MGKNLKLFCADHMRTNNDKPAQTIQTCANNIDQKMIQGKN